ncbi:MAG: EVE domain-containing protein [Porticoccaceae bacterium]
MNHWLFKSEPDVYGIDHLAAEPGQQGRWDGIRNYQARNHLKDTVEVGDQVLFYHSSCPQPGVAGVMEVTKAAYPDPAQFDPGSDYYDPKATQEKPRWYAVDVKLVRRFPKVIASTLMKQQPLLSGMQMFKQGRLSVVPLTETEWQTVLSMAD